MGTASITQILDPVIRLLNLVTGASAFIFLVMLFYSAYKYAMAQGDPKGLMGAKETLSNAILGFIIAVGSFAIITWVANILGLDSGILNDPSGRSEGAIQEFIEFINVNNEGDFQINQGGTGTTGTSGGSSGGSGGGSTSPGAASGGSGTGGQQTPGAPATSY